MIPRAFVCSLALVCLALAGAARGACEIPAPARLTPPSVDGKPVKIAIGFTLIDIIAVKDADQTFTADLVFSMDWRDPRLSVASRGSTLVGCRLAPEDVWHPDLGAINRRALTFIFGPRVTVDSDGHVRYEARGFGDFSSPLKLREFPFDSQELRVRVASFKYGPDEVEFVGRKTERAANPGYALAGWTFLGSFSDTGVGPAEIGAEKFSRIDYVIEVRRDAGYYMWNFVIPLSFIVFMAWTVFWLDPQAAGVQIGIATASAFTLVAFLVALRGRLPPVPYLTRMDELILFSTALVFLALAQAVLTSRLAQIEKHALAKRLDAYGRWIYLAAFGVVLYVTVIR